MCSACNSQVVLSIGVAWNNFKWSPVIQSQLAVATEKRPFPDIGNLTEVSICDERVDAELDLDKWVTKTISTKVLSAAKVTGCFIMSLAESFESS